MNNQKSIIGCGYIPRNAQAICLKTRTYTKLGEGVYKIIKDPYELVLGGIRLRLRRYMAVDVLDALTGLTYAVKYEPANLVRSTLESKTDQPGEPVDFATRAGQIAEELKATFDPTCWISDKCAVAFFAFSDDGNDKTAMRVGYVGGRMDRVSEAIASACSENPQVLEVVKHASIKAMLHRIFDGDNKKK